MTEALRAIRGPLFGLFLAAVDTGDNKAASTLSGRLHENLARTAKLTGELVPQRVPASTNILLSPDFQRLRVELIRVLARYPQAQAEVAAVFRQAGLRAATEIGGSAEKMIEGLPLVRSRESPRPWLRTADNHGYRRFSGAGPTTSLVVGRGGFDSASPRRVEIDAVGLCRDGDERRGLRLAPCRVGLVDVGAAPRRAMPS